jgi:hypothetical protein
MADYNLNMIKMRLDEIQKILNEKKLRLDVNGLYNPSIIKFQKEPAFYEFKENNLNNILSCIIEIQQIYKPYKTAYKINSYNGKHKIERYRKNTTAYNNPYISNGEFIAAMMLTNIKYKRVQSTVNCSFLGTFDF